ncbi:MAG: hypothetical protein NVSMB3_13690 [Acidobacteriaceae bacterium]
MKSKIWFITGASRGFGRIWAEAALLRGDRVAATARRVADVAGLAERFGDAVLPLSVDVTDAGQVRHAVEQAHAHFGRLDVVLNNAGYSLVGTVEEASEAEVRALFDANYFGTLRVIQAALPLLRRQGGGHIVGVSSSLGIVSVPLIGSYCASKWAFEALHESLAQEVRQFGIRVTMLEPGAYATDFGSPSSLKFARGLDAYADLRAQVFGRLSGSEKGDPAATTEAILQIVDAEDPPLRFFVGSTGLPMARAAYAARLAMWEAWEGVSNAAQGEPRRTDAATLRQQPGTRCVPDPASEGRGSAPTGSSMGSGGGFGAGSRGPGPAGALEVEGHGSADEIPQSRLIHRVVRVDVQGAPDVPVEAGVEEMCGVPQRSTAGEGQLDYVFVGLSRADDAAVGPDGSSSPLPLFDDLRVGLVDDFAHFRESFSAPVPELQESVDLLVDRCGGGLHREVSPVRL